MELPASLLYFELDGFKAVNDRFGHADDDRALTAFAKLPMPTFRDSDVVGRLGGSELVARMTDSDEAECAIAIQRLQQVEAGDNWTSQRGYDILFSVGDIAFEPIRHTGGRAHAELGGISARWPNSQHNAAQRRAPAVASRSCTRSPPHASWVASLRALVR